MELFTKRENTSINLYYSFIFPYLIYCNEIWGNACQTHLDPLIKLEALFRQLDTLNFRKLVIHRIALLMFKYNIRKLPQPTMQLFIRNTDVYNQNTRSKESLHVQMSRTERTYSNVSFHGVHIWNILSQHVQTNISYESFKHVSTLLINTHNINYRLRTDI